MDKKSPLLGGFVATRASTTAEIVLSALDLIRNPMELLVDTLETENVSAIYTIKNLFIFGNIIDLHVATSHGDYGMRISETAEALFEVRITNLSTFVALNTFTLSKNQPSGLPEVS